MAGPTTAPRLTHREDWSRQERQLLGEAQPLGREGLLVGPDLVSGPESGRTDTTAAYAGFRTSPASLARPGSVRKGATKKLPNVDKG